MTFIHRLLASGFRFWSASIFCLPSAHGSTLRTNKEIEFFQSLSIKPKNRRQKLFRATDLQYGLHSWTTHLPRATLWSVPIFLFVFKGKKVDPIYRTNTKIDTDQSLKPEQSDRCKAHDKDLEPSFNFDGSEFEFIIRFCFPPIFKQKIDFHKKAIKKFSFFHIKTYHKIFRGWRVFHCW